MRGASEYRNSRKQCFGCNIVGHILAECRNVKFGLGITADTGTSVSVYVSNRFSMFENVCNIHVCNCVTNACSHTDSSGDSCGVSSDLDGYRGALKREVFFHTFFCVLVRICNQTSSNQHLLVVGC